VELVFNELEWTEKEAVVNFVEVLFQNLSGRDEEIQGYP
jgi:hypothetical protein